MKDVLQQVEWSSTYGSLAKRIDKLYTRAGCGDSCRAQLAAHLKEAYPAHYEELRSASNLSTTMTAALQRR